jgi:protein-S-isoprenylcysteine O-methyltransferase Ste14
MKERKGEHPYGDAGQLILVAVFLAVWATDSFVLHWSTFLKEWDPNSIRMVVTAVAAALAFTLFFSGRVVIQKERPDHVVDTGPFRRVRHPLYLAALLGLTATAVSSLSLLSLALLVPIFLFYNYLADYEERLLETRFGDAYREYKARTGKWFPTWRP